MNFVRKDHYIFLIPYFIKLVSYCHLVNVKTILILIT